MEQIQRGAVYIRVSTADQLEFSPTAQLKAIKDYAHKNNIFIDDDYIYIDEGISGRKAEKRPAFMKMIATAKSKPTPFDIILVHKFDRFARNREDSIVYKSLLKRECNIKVVSITEQLEDDKFSVILEAMLEAMAEYYSLNLSDEVKKGMTEKAEKGGVQTIPSYGYKIEKNQYIIIEEEAEIVKLIFEKYVYQNKGFLEIAKEINNLGARTHRGNKFENRTIEYILRSPIYVGKMRWTTSGKRSRNDYNNPDTLIVQGNHKAIISQELFDLAQEKILKQKARANKFQRTSSPSEWWLRGLLRCSMCGSTLVKCGQKYLHCNAYAKGTCACTSSIALADAKELIINQIKNDINTTTPKISIISTENSTNELIIIQNQLSKIDTKLNRAKQLYLEEVDTLEEYKKNKAMIENEKLQLEKKLKELEKKNKSSDANKIFKKNLQNVYETLISNADEKTKYEVAHSIIKNIIFDKNNATLDLEYYLQSTVK